MLGQLPCPARIVDDRFDLAPVANDPFVSEQALDVALGVAGDPVEIEAVERGTEVLALGEDGAPAQPRLEGGETADVRLLSTA